MGAAYIGVMRQQGDRPLGWVLGMLLGGAASAAYGARRAAPRRRAVLGFGGCVLTGLGVLALLSIGLPIVVAGVLCILAAVRSPHRVAT